MQMWVIKHVPSGKYLPAPRGRGGRGGTHVDIGDPGSPRLFSTEVAARSAPRWWLGGEVHVGQFDVRTFDDEWTEEDWTIKPRPDRIAEDMAVVAVVLVEQGA